MQAIEFEAIAQQHIMQIPDQVPDGVRLRVLILLEEPERSVVPVPTQPTPKPDTEEARRAAYLEQSHG